MNKGKAYANRRPKGNLSDLRASDFYETPRSLIWELLKAAKDLDDVRTVLEPCCGNYAISSELKKVFPVVVERDLKYGNDFLEDEYEEQSFDAVITNPPFSAFDAIVNKARYVAKKVYVIGKTNFLGAYSRYKSNFWNELKCIYVFDRQIDYQFPVMDDGSCGVGCLVSGFYEWEKGYKGEPVIRFIDIQKYCKLGSYESFIKKQGENK